MTIELYPKDAYFMMVNSSKTHLGAYSIPQSGDLSLAHGRLYHRNAGAYDFQLRLVVSRSVLGPALVASNWEQFNNDVTGQTSEFWLGDVTFTFPRYPLVAGTNYYFRLETNGYIRQDNDAYLGIWIDWMQPVGVANTGGARLALGVKQ